MKVATYTTASVHIMSKIMPKSESGDTKGARLHSFRPQRTPHGCRRTSCRVIRPAMRCRKSHDERSMRALGLELFLLARSSSPLAVSRRNALLSGLFVEPLRLLWSSCRDVLLACIHLVTWERTRAQLPHSHFSGACTA